MRTTTIPHYHQEELLDYIMLDVAKPIVLPTPPPTIINYNKSPPSHIAQNIAQQMTQDYLLTVDTYHSPSSTYMPPSNTQLHIFHQTPHQ